MKKLFLFIFLAFFYIVGFSQNSLTMDSEVVPIVENFIKEGEKRGFYLRFLLMERIDNILFLKDLGTGVDTRLGTVSADYRSIYLASKLKEDKLLLKITIFHEIGHIIKFNGNHSCFNCYDIMSEYAPQDLRAYESEAFMKHKLDEYFAWLNSVK